MNFLKLNGVKTLSKATQQKIKGGVDECRENSYECVTDCIFVQKKDSLTCYIECIMPCGNN